MKHVVSLMITLALCQPLFSQNEAYKASLYYRLQHTTDTALAQTYLEYARLIASEKKFDSAELYYHKMEQLSEQIAYARGLRYANSGKAALYLQRAPEKATSYYLKAIELSDKNKDKAFIAAMRANLGILKFNAGDRQTGLQAIIDAIPIVEAGKDTFDLMAICSWACECYLAMADAKGGAPYNEKAITLYHQMKPETFITFFRQFRLEQFYSVLSYRQATVYYFSGDYKKAIPIYKELLKGKRIANDYLSKSEYYNYIAYSWLGLNEPQQCLVYTDSILDCLKKDSTYLSYQAAYHVRSLAYKQMGNYKQALIEYEKLKMASDKLNETKLENKVHSVQHKYEAAQKDKEIDYLKKQRQLNRLLIGISVLAAVIALFAFLMTRRSKKYKEKLLVRDNELLASEKEREKNQMQLQLLELEQMALRAQMNPHFIFNSLNSVQYYVINRDLAGANKYVSMLGSLIRLTLDYSAKPAISLAEELDYMRKYMELEKMRMQDKFDYAITLGEGIDTEELLLPPLLLQPFVENAIKHGIRNLENASGMIDIAITKLPGAIKYTITDNGVGRELAAKYNSSFSDGHQSKGITLTQKRIQLLNNTTVEPLIQIEDLKDDTGKATGTRVVIVLPEEIS